MERAEAVKVYLYEHHQIPLHKMNVISYGEDKPVAPNKTKAGRAQNRRVVIKVLVSENRRQSSDLMVEGGGREDPIATTKARGASCGSRLFLCVPNLKRSLNPTPGRLRADRAVISITAIRTELTLRLPTSPAPWPMSAPCGGRTRPAAGAATRGERDTSHLVDNPVRAAGTLRERRHNVTENDVLVAAVSNAHGALAATLALLQDAGANVEYAYAATSESSETTFLVLGVDDALRARTASGL